MNRKEVLELIKFYEDEVRGFLEVHGNHYSILRKKHEEAIQLLRRLLHTEELLDSSLETNRVLVKRLNEIQDVLNEMTKESEDWMGDSESLTRNTIRLMKERNEAYTKAFEDARADVEEMGGRWMDISSAPKDGTNIIAWSPCFDQPTVVHWFISNDETCCGWFDDELECYTNDDGSTELTHWMPLPKPPLTI